MTELKINKSKFNVIKSQIGISYSHKINLHVKIYNLLTNRNYRVYKISEIENDNITDFENIRLFV